MNPGVTRLVAPALVLVLAAAGFWTVFQGSRGDPSTVSALLVQTPGAAGFKRTPSSSQVVAARETNWSELRTAAKTDPGPTGAYSRTWEATTTSGSSVSILVVVLPTASDAPVLRTQILSDYTDAKTLKADDISIVSRFSVAGVPDSAGLSYRGSGSKSADKGSIVVFREGRAVAVVTAGSSSAHESDDAGARSAARAEDVLLHGAEPNFSMSVATRSTAVSLLYWLIALGVAVTVFVVPGIVQRRREARRTKELAQTRSGHRGRGSKVLRRQKVSLPIKHARRGRSVRLPSRR